MADAQSRRVYPLPDADGAVGAAGGDHHRPARGARQRPPARRLATGLQALGRFSRIELGQFDRDETALPTELI
jgi:hypothetical protein